MEQTIPFDEIKGEQTLPLCQKCLERVATETCPKCGCPLCFTCKKEHVCLKEKTIN